MMCVMRVANLNANCSADANAAGPLDEVLLVRRRLPRPVHDGHNLLMTPAAPSSLVDRDRQAEEEERDRRRGRRTKRKGELKLKPATVVELTWHETNRKKDRSISKIRR